MRREYKLAADPIRQQTRQMREIVEITDGGYRTVILVAADHDAIGVRAALERVYEQGREDNAPHFHGSGCGEPCWCSSPLTYAPQGPTGYGSEEEQR